MTKWTLSLIATFLLFFGTNANANEGRLMQAENVNTEIRGATHEDTRISSSLKIKRAGRNISSSVIAPMPSFGLVSSTKTTKRVQNSAATCDNAFQKQIKRQRSKVRYCYDKMLRNHKKEGTLKVLVHAQQGKVNKVSFAKSTIQNDQLESCVEKTVSKIELPSRCTDSFRTSYLLQR